MTTSLWVSSSVGTCIVMIDELDIIVDTCPLWKRFLNQPLSNLLNWLGRKGDVQKERL